MSISWCDSRFYNAPPLRYFTTVSYQSLLLANVLIYSRIFMSQDKHTTGVYMRHIVIFKRNCDIDRSKTRILKIFTLSKEAINCKALSIKF